MSSDLRHNSHSVSKLLAHLVFVVKYRHSAITDPVWGSLCSGFAAAAQRLDVAIIQANHDRNHAHLVVEYPPKVSVSTIAHALKGRSSFVVRRACKAELRRKLWAPRSGARASSPPPAAALPCKLFCSTSKTNNPKPP